MKYCEFCGNYIEDDNAKFCPDCGGQLKDSKPSDEKIEESIPNQPIGQNDSKVNEVIKKVAKGANHMSKFYVILTIAIGVIILGITLISLSYNNLIVSKLDIVEVEGTVATVDVSYNEDGENVYEVGVVYDYEENNYNYSFETTTPKYVVNDTLPIYILENNPSEASEISPEAFGFIGKVVLIFGIVLTTAGSLCVFAVAIVIIKKIKGKK
ncbi:MAG: hypothetical protein K6A63_03990 [Acholeplasmatales bacterium]|nr:hypothetical protein [Acholeplasmatales bacterium]